MILGADPDKSSKEWDEDVRPSVRPRRGVMELINYFAYHKNMRMTQRFNDQDRAILASYCSRKLSGGFSSAAIKQLFDKFYASSYSASDYPVLMFCKKEVQEHLLDEAEYAVEDEVLSWLVDGMPNEAPLSDPQEARRAVVLTCDESLLRYPEVVADVLRLDDPEPHLSERLEALESLVLWNLGKLADGSAGQYHEVLCSISLPPELGTSVRSPKGIREKKQTVKQAAAFIKTKSNKEKW